MDYIINKDIRSELVIHSINKKNSRILRIKRMDPTRIPKLAYEYKQLGTREWRYLLWNWNKQIHKPWSGGEADEEIE